LAAADALWRGFQFEEALSAFQSAADRAPANPLPLLLAAKRLFAIGRFAESGAFLRSALAREPGNHSIRRMLAEILERNGELVAAEEMAREALTQSPENSRGVHALARILRRTNRVNEAVELLRNHLCDRPERETWRINHELANCLDAQGNFSEAIAALLKAKAELRPIAQPFLQEWHRRAERRREFAGNIDAETLSRWSKVTDAFCEKHRLAIIAGHPRSGTTLLEQMLARHSEIVTTDETGILRRQFVEPLVMAAASARAAFEEVDCFDVGQLEAGRVFYIQATERQIGEPVRGRLLLEKDPLATGDLGLILRLLPESHIVFPLRDPRDVCVSYFFTILPFNADSAPAIGLESTCVAVSLTLKLWRHWKENIPQPWSEIRYEDLVKNPRAEVAQVLQSLSLPFEEEMLGPAKMGTARGILAPSYADVAEPLYTRAIGRWKNYAEWLEPYATHFEPLLREFGYS